MLALLKQQQAKLEEHIAESKSLSLQRGRHSSLPGEVRLEAPLDPDLVTLHQQGVHLDTLLLVQIARFVKEARDRLPSPPDVA